MRFLVIEDDKKIAELLQSGFQQAGYNADISADGIEAFELAMQGQYDLLIVDVMIPRKDGFTLVEELRAKGFDTPVLFLSAKRSTEDRVEGFKRGGDDYLVKPFSFSELLVRCRAILKRTTKQSGTSKLEYHGMEMDLLTRIVQREGKSIELHQKEFSLLEFFLRNQGRVLTKTQILETVWKYDFDPQTNVVDVLVCRLRNKVDADFDEKLIKTIRGVGYVLRAE